MTWMAALVALGYLYAVLAFGVLGLLAIGLHVGALLLCVAMKT